MAQSQTGDDASNRAIGETTLTPTLADQAVRFRFALALKCLSTSLQSCRSVETAPASGLGEGPRITPVPADSPALPSVVASAPASVMPAPVQEASATARESTGLTPGTNIANPPPGLPRELSGHEFRLETTVPTLRALKKPGAEVALGDPRLPPAGPVSPPCSAYAVSKAVESSPAKTKQVAATESFPNLYTAPSSPRKSLFLKLGAATLAAAAILLPVGMHFFRSVRNPQPKAESIGRLDAGQVEDSVRGPDWLRQAAVGADPGVEKSRQFVLYKQGQKVADSRIEFAWSTDSGEVGVVFRAKDLGNYYAVRLKLRNPRTTPTLAVEYFSVDQFVESAHTEKYLELFRIDPVVRVRLEVFGPKFTLYLQDNVTEHWTDERLTSGAIGFFEESNRSPQVNAVRVSLGERSKVIRNPLGEKPQFWTLSRALSKSGVSGGV